MKPKDALQLKLDGCALGDLFQALLIELVLSEEVFNAKRPLDLSDGWKWGIMVVLIKSGVLVGTLDEEAADKYLSKMIKECFK